MIVRCGRCRAELEVSGPGEFICPACGTRNAVRGDAGASPAAGAFGLGASPSGLGASPSGLTVPGGMPPSGPPAPAGPTPGVKWDTCPACGFRFAMGEVEKITCPNCRAAMDRSEDGALVLQSG